MIFSHAFSHHDHQLFRFHAQQSDIGGLSHIDGTSRQNQPDYQFTQQVGEAMLHIALGYSLGDYDGMRAAQNRRRHVGDTGTDCPLYTKKTGTKVDVKASLVRTSRKLLEHRLWVRPREKRADRYVLVLVEPEYVHAHLIGWCKPDMLRWNARGSRWFANAYDLLPWASF